MSRIFQFNVCDSDKLTIEVTNWGDLPRRHQTIKVLHMNALIVRSKIHNRSSKNGKVAFEENPLNDFGLSHYLIITRHLRTLGLAVPQFKTDDSLRHLVAGLKEACHGKCTNSFKPTCSN